MVFGKKKQVVESANGRLPEFSYLNSDDIYMDSACQSVRPQPVVNSLTEYYENFNACGGRVKYKWGQKVDSIVEQTRQELIDYLGLPAKDYVCSFTLNTTYGINSILTQLKIGNFKQIVTSEIEHNSVFLPTIEFAKKHNIPRKVLKRATDGSLIYSASDIENAVVVVNAVSNADGRTLKNIKQLVDDVHKSGGIVIIDAAQALAHYRELLSGVQADAYCFSAHKMYAASLGGIVIRVSLLRQLDIHFIGGGPIATVSENNYTMLPDDLASWLEPGLQAYGEIISLHNAINWLKDVKPNGVSVSDHIAKMSTKLYEGLASIPGIKMLSDKPTSVISLSHDKIDSHRLAIFLSGAGIMVRSGYFCCHYYLIESLKLPPLVRFSIGLHTTESDIEKTIAAVTKFTKG